MSAPFRKKIIDQLVASRTAKGRKKIEKWLAGYFDNGVLRIERKDWEETYTKAVSALGAAQGAPFTVLGGVMPIPNAEWKRMTAYIKANFITDRNIIVSKQSVPDSKKIVLRYRRNPGSAIGAVGPVRVDIERAARRKLTKITTKFFVTEKFEWLEELVENKATQQTYGHGKRDEPDFGDKGEYHDGRGAVKKIQDSLKNQSSSGAQGTLVNNIVKANLVHACQMEFSKENWFDSFFETLFLKYTDLFGYDSDLHSTDKLKSKESKLVLHGKMMESSWANKMKLNKGVFDKAIRKELIEFLGGEEGKDPLYFIKEAKRLDPTLTSDKGLGMFKDSPNPKDKIETAAIALIAAGVMDDISEKYVKNDISKNLKKKNKSGNKSSKTKAKGRSAKRRQTSKKATGAGLAQASKRRNNASGLAGQMATRNPIALKELIQAALPDEVLERMTLPALVNRTGRFRQSATITNVLIGARGGTEVEYTYMKDPYQTFEPGGKRGGTYRDPRRIIGGAIKDIAMDLTGNKFIRTRRV